MQHSEYLYTCVLKRLAKKSFLPARQLAQTGPNNFSKQLLETRELYHQRSGFPRRRGAPPAWNHERRVERSLCKCLSTGSFCHYYLCFTALRFVGILLNCSHLPGKSSLEGKMRVDDENIETIFIALYVVNISHPIINFYR